MKKLAVFILMIILTAPLAACAVLPNSNVLSPRTHDITMQNHWQFLHVNLVRMPQGARLQFFPSIENSTFTNVLVTYSAYPTSSSLFPETRIAQISSTGTGQTIICAQVFPRIINVAGSVEYLA